MAAARNGSHSDDPTPPPYPQPLTKRDVRRNRITEKLQGVIDSFDSNQHQHYRAQLQGVQVDMTLVLRADPFEVHPLADSHDEIQELVESIMNGDRKGNGKVNLPNDEAARTDYWNMAGKRYRDFVRAVNDAKETRDAAFTALSNNFNSSAGELSRIYQQRLHQADEEHKALSVTIRQRLIASLTKKRQQLLRDKEQLDITDSNAMLMHPNHFSIGNNPGSPGYTGGAANKRTRHLRHHRGTSPAPGVAEAGENGKKKRKFGHFEDEHNGNESSAPPPISGRLSPFKDTRAQREYAQFEAPAYSIERIFTEKELALATDTAKIATYKYFHQPQQQAHDPASNGDGTAVPSVDGEIIESAEAVPEDAATDRGVATNGAVNTPPPSHAMPAAAPEMERSTSHQVLTRGGARANPLAALSDLANAAAAASSTVPVIRDNPFAPVAPPYHAVTRSEKSGAPAPPAVNSLDIENDFEMMRRLGADNPTDADNDTVLPDAAAAEEARELRRQLLDQALGHKGVPAPYRLPLVDSGPGALIGRGVDREPRSAFAPILPVLAPGRSANVQPTSLAAALGGRLGAEPMSRTTSAGGVSEIGEPVATGPGRRGGRGRMV